MLPRACAERRGPRQARFWLAGVEEAERTEERSAQNNLMSQDQIKFGTDGWRGVIADDFTFENVRLAAAAISSYVLKHEDSARGLIVGYDTRFGSERFA